MSELSVLIKREKMFSGEIYTTGKKFTPAVTAGPYLTFDHMYVTRDQDGIGCATNVYHIGIFYRTQVRS